MYPSSKGINIIGKDDDYVCEVGIGEVAEADAKLICAAPDLLRLAARYRANLVSEYESLMETITDADGNIVDPGDGECIQEIQRDIDALDDVMKEHGLVL